MSNSNYLDTLNPSQRAAVEYCDGPQLVIAGAGSGKTRVLTCKIAYLLQNGYTPDSIIALTFTKKAATEMQQRIDQLVGGKSAHRLWMGTFHSLFCRILRREAQRIGFRSDFTIYDQTDSRSLVKAIIKEMGLDDKQYKPNSVQGQISNAKNHLITPSMYVKNRDLMNYDAIAKRPKVGEIYQRYWNRCYQAGAMDFDDLLLYTNILFRDHPDVLEFYQDYFRYVLVDEYQDTNRAQHLIVEQLAKKHKKLTVVGDDAQSIYSFRGANIRNILDLRTQIPETKLFKLEQNYRSTQNIVDAANSLIAKNKEQIQKTIYSEKERGSLLRLISSYSDLEESYLVSQRVAALHDEENYNYRDCAILYRTNAQSRSLEEALRKQGIDYRIFGGLSFYQRKEIKDIIAMLRLTVNPYDEEAFKRVLKESNFGIGDTTLAKIGQAVAEAAVQNQRLSFYEVTGNPDAFIAVNSGTKGKLFRFHETVEDCLKFAASNNVYETVREVTRRFGYNEVLAKESDTIEGKAKMENVQELVDSIQQAVIDYREAGNGELSVTEYLSTISLDEPDPAKDDPYRDYVALMTIHQAKGLEFKNVFVAGVEENLLPSDMSIDEPAGVEEERRLFYVAITRAEQNCFLSYATSRFRNGKSEACRPSRFLKDIDPRFIQQVNGATPVVDYSRNGGGSFYSSRSFAPSYESNRSYATTPKPSSTFGNADGTRPRTPMDLNHPRKVAVRQTALETPTSLVFGGKELTQGTRIVHERFGQGTIKELSGRDGDARIVVTFDTMGDKTLLLKFAKFTVVE
ncbi:MAG: UvrD-helicase domain-containing protein [Bacteroidales bacterium]|nr:UvrD-helicase domain-containing protein [Bacteroidales bacterium]